MTPAQKIKHAIMINAEIEMSEHISANEIDELYDENLDELYDEKYNFREGNVETCNIEKEYSRHLESKTVATLTQHGWVGWIYWYGGGKYAEPEAIEWINESYDLICKEEEKLVIVRTFTKVEEK